MYAEKVLRPIKCVGLNPYKMVEMFKNYRPVVPVEFHSDELYAEPSLYPTNIQGINLAIKRVDDSRHLEDGSQSDYQLVYARGVYGTYLLILSWPEHKPPPKRESIEGC